MHPRHQPTQHTAVRSTQHSGHTTGQCEYRRSAATPSAPLFLCAILSFYSNVTYATMGEGGAAERPYEQKQPQYVRPVSLKQLNRSRRKGNGVDITPHTFRLSARRLSVRASAIQEAKCLTTQFSKIQMPAINSQIFFQSQYCLPKTQVSNVYRSIPAITSRVSNPSPKLKYQVSTLKYQASNLQY